jgi:hypothetical protein
MADFADKIKSKIHEHPNPERTEQSLVVDESDQSIYAVGDIDGDSAPESENLRTGKTREFNDPIGMFGFLKEKEPLGIGATEETKERATELAKATRASPKDVFKRRSKKARRTDINKMSDDVTSDPFEYALNPDEKDFEGFDVPGGDAERFL